MSDTFTENPRACLGLTSETPLLLCLADPEALDAAERDLAARLLACCPKGVLLFCRVHGGTMPCLSDDFPESLPWHPLLSKSLEHQAAEPACCLILEHTRHMDLFAALLPEAAVVIDFEHANSAAAVSMALREAVPVASLSGAGAAILQKAGLEDLIPKNEDAFVELGVNMAANPWRMAHWTPLLKQARTVLRNPLTDGAPKPSIDIPRKISAAYQPDSWMELDIDAPGRATSTVHTRGLDLEGQVGTYYGRHRSGWEFVTEAMAPLHNTSAVYFESFLERRFAWGNWCDMPGSPILKPWVGVVHVPPTLPEWFGLENTLPHIMQTEHWKLSAPYCRGLFTLTEWLRDQIRPFFPDLPIDVLRHPTDLEVPEWSPNNFLANPIRSLVQVGTSYRNLHAMALLPEHPLHRTVLTGNADSFEKLYAAEKAVLLEEGLPTTMGHPVTYLNFLANDLYDGLLTENVLFAEYYTASASNLIVECMARATPLLVNRLDPVVEYLGEDYPLYYTSYEEAAEKLHDTQRILDTHEYLRHWNRDILDRITFMYDILHSSVLRSVDLRRNDIR